MTATLLANRAVIRLSGEDVSGFVNGLVTNDVAGPLPVWAALLTPQGKVLFDFIVWGGDDYLLIDCEARQADHLVFSYPPRRNLKSGLVSAFMGGWFLFFTCIFIVKGAAGPEIVMLPVFGLIGLALVFYAVWMFGYSLEVAAAAAELVVVRRFLGMPVKRVLIPAAALKAVEAIRYGVLGSGSTAKLIFTVVARCGDGTRITVEDGIEGRTNAEAIARMIAQKYGLGVSRDVQGTTV